MPKGYPRSRFDIVDRTHVQEIKTEVAPNPTAVVMATYTSDKGSEDWELMYGLNDFTTSHGGMSFIKHGQAQLLVAEVLRNGGYVFGKRLVHPSATMANITIKVRTVVDGGVTYIYPYATSTPEMSSLDAAAEAGYGDFDPTADLDDMNDFPLFTITPIGRGASNLFIHFAPEYSASKSSSTTRYSIEVWENSQELESIMFTMNPDIIIDDVSQSIQAKLNTQSKQVRCKLFEDGVFQFVRKLAATARLQNDPDTPLPLATLVNYDFINGMNVRGSTALAGVVSAKIAAGSDDTAWSDNRPNDIADSIIDTSSVNDIGVHLLNGSYGDMTNSPMSTPESRSIVDNLMLNAWGAGDTDYGQYDPIIYDLDAFKPDVVFDCGFSTAVKNAIIAVCEFRGDMCFLADLGTTHKNQSAIINAAAEINSSRFVAIYHNFFKILDPYTRKDITVTMPYLLAKRMLKHVTNGAGRPFAGIANNVYFPEIIKGSVNFLPIVTPTEDQKQKFVDANINYLSYYDGVPVMETMYTNSNEYTQMSYLHNILAVQEVVKAIRSRCPRTRYTFLDGNDLEQYLIDAESVVKSFATNFRSITIQYMADEKYESNNIFYATLIVQFRNFVQEEYFKVIAIT